MVEPTGPLGTFQDPEDDEQEQSDEELSPEARARLGKVSQRLSEMRPDRDELLSQVEETREDAAAGRDQASAGGALAKDIASFADQIAAEVTGRDPSRMRQSARSTTEVHDEDAEALQAAQQAVRQEAQARITARDVPNPPLPTRLKRERRLASLTDEAGAPLYPEIQQRWLNRDPDELRRASAEEAAARARRMGKLESTDSLNPLRIGKENWEEFKNQFNNFFSAQDLSARGELIETVGQVFGDEEMENWGHQIKVRGRQAVTDSPPRVRRLTEIDISKPADIANFMAALGGQMVGQIAGSAEGALMGAATTALLVPEPTSSVAGASALAVGTMLGMGSQWALFHKNQDEGKLRRWAQDPNAPDWTADPVMRDLVSTISGMGKAGIELAMEGKVGSEVLESVLEGASRSMLRRAASRGLPAGRTEAGEEAGQQLIEGAVEAMGSPEPINPVEFGIESINAIASGFLGGLQFGGVSVVPEEAANRFVTKVNELTQQGSEVVPTLHRLADRQELLDSVEEMDDAQLARVRAEARVAEDQELESVVEAEAQRRLNALENETVVPGAAPSAQMEAETQGQTESLREEAISPDEAKAELEIGDIIGKKKMVNVTSQGTPQWMAIDHIAPEEGSTDNEYQKSQRVAAPSDEEIVSFVRQKRGPAPDAEVPDEPSVVMEQAAAESGISAQDEQFNEFRKDVEVIRLDHRNSGMAGTARRGGRGLPGGEEAILRRIKALKSIATSTSENINETQRKTALGRALALEDVLGEVENPNQPQMGAIRDLARQVIRDNTLTAKQAIDRWLSPSMAQGPRREAVAREVQRLQQEGIAQRDVQRDHQTIREEVLPRENRRISRGVATGTKIRTQDGRIGEVVEDPEFGFARVEFGERDGQTHTEDVDLHQVDLLPNRGQYVRLNTGDIVRNQGLIDETGTFASPERAGRMRAELPDGSTVDVGVDNISQVAENQKVEEGFAQSFTEAQELTREQGMMDFDRPQQAVHRLTGQEVTVTAQNQEFARTIDANNVERVVPREDLTVGSEQEPNMSLTTFQPGTTPQAENTHINFIQLSEADAGALESAIEAGNEQMVSSILEEASQSGKIHLMPQPQQQGTTQFAVEVPAEARELTDASRRLLGVLTGNEPESSITPNTLTARVHIDPEAVVESDQQLRVMRVPPGLNAAVQSPFKIDAINQEDGNARQYLQRLTALDFDVSPEVAQRLEEARQLGDETRDLRERGEHGAAEHRAIEARAKRQEADEQKMREVHAEIRNIWDDFAEDAREAGGLEESLQSEDQQERMRAIRQALDEMPGRRGNNPGEQKLVFSHPTAPGFRLLIDKQTMTISTERGAPMTRERLREMLGGMQEIELEGGVTVERDPVDQLSTEEYLELVRGETGLRTQDVYNVEILTPSDRHVLHRRIGAERPQVSVPKSLVESGEAQSRIMEAAQQGEDPMAVVEAMRDERESTDAYRFPDVPGEWEVMDIREEEVTLQRLDPVETSAAPNEITINRAQFQAAEEVQVDEPLSTISFPRELEQNEVLDEVMAQIESLDARVDWYSVGQFRHNLDPKLYASIHQLEDGSWRARVFKEPTESRSLRDKRSTLDLQEDFDSEEAAESWLEDRGFSRGQTETRPAEMFRELPDVESVPVSKMPKVEMQLRKILGTYLGGWDGYIPQPVRDYATSFAVRWHQMGLQARDALPDQKQGIYGDWQIRRALNLFTERDLFHASRNVDNEVRPNQDRVLEGILLSDNESNLSPDRLKKAREIWKEQAHKRRLMETAVPGGGKFDFGKDLIESHKLVRWGDDRRLGIVEQGNLKMKVLKVRYFEQGEEKTANVPLEAVEAVISRDVADQYVRNLQENVGEMNDIPVTQDMGFGSLDKEFGLDGVTDPDIFEERFIQRASRVMNQIRIDEDGDIDADVDDATIEKAKEIFIRTKELGLDEAEQELFDGPFRFIEQEALYDLADQYSQVSAFGDIVAKAKLDMLDERQQEAVEQQRRFFGLPRDVPQWKVVEHLIQNVWDPRMANMVHDLRDQQGFLRLAAGIDGVQEDLNVNIEFRQRAPRTPDTSLSDSFYSMPRTFGEKHPVFDLFHRLSERARDKLGSLQEHGAKVISGLAGLDVSTEAAPNAGKFGDSIEMQERVWGLLQNEDVGAEMDDPTQTLPADDARREALGYSPDDIPTVEEVVGEENLPDWNWKEPYSVLRDLIVAARRREIASMKKEGYEPQYIEPASERDEEQAIDWDQVQRKYNLDDADRQAIRERVEAGERVPLMRPVSDTLNGVDTSQIEVFLDLLEQYPNAAAVREATENPEALPDWMLEEFDFWKQWGINNYAPRIVQGSFLIRRESDGQPVGMAPSGGHAYRMIEREVKKGNFDPQEEYVVEPRRIENDQMDVQVIDPQDFRKWYAQVMDMFEKDVGPGSADWTNALTTTLQRAEGITELRPAQLDHLQARSADFSNTIESPLRRMMVYWSRVQRHDFSVNIVRNWNVARRMDTKISRAFGMGTNELFNNGTLVEAMEDLRDSYLGRETKMEQKINAIAGVARAIARKPATFLKNIAKKATQDPNYSVFNDPEMQDAIHNVNYATREFTDRAIALQSVLRLGGNIGGAVANATQTPMYVPAELMLRGASVSDATQYWIESYKDMMKYYRQSYAERREASGDIGLEEGYEAGTEEGRVLTRLAEDVGIQLQPAKGTQGAGLGIMETIDSPNFGDGSPIDGMANFGEYAMMLPFGTAEVMNRLSTAFAAYRMAQDRGDSYDASVSFARDVIDNTQFQYYDAALPEGMRGGPMRLLLQFKPFVVNALKFQKDLMKGILVGKTRGTTQVKRPDGTWISVRRSSLNAMMAHLIAGLSFGGSAWMGANALTGLFSTLLGWITHAFGGVNAPGSELLHAKYGRKQIQEYPGPEVGNQDLMQVRDLVVGGLPGYFGGVSLGGRLAVGGQDANPFQMNIGNALGPTGDWVLQYVSGIRDYLANRGTDDPKAMLGAAVAGAAGTITGRYFGGPGLRTGLFLAPVGMTMSTAATANPFRDWLMSRRGGQFISEIMPPWLDAVRMEVELHRDNYFPDGTGNLRKIPPGPSRKFEKAYTALNMASVADVQESAYRSLFLREMQKDVATRRAFVDLMVQATSAADRERMMLLKERAEAANMPGLIGEGADEAVMRRLRRLEQVPLERMLERHPNLRTEVLEAAAEEGFVGERNPLF